MHTLYQAYNVRHITGSDGNCRIQLSPLRGPFSAQGHTQAFQAAKAANPQAHALCVESVIVPVSSKWSRQ